MPIYVLALYTAAQPGALKIAERAIEADSAGQAVEMAEKDLARLLAHQQAILWDEGGDAVWSFTAGR
jgi:hypothetical protein